MNATATLPAPAFDLERLSKATYLTMAEAAFYCGYTLEGGYSDPVDAFRCLVRRQHIHHFHLGRGVRFRRKDLDLHITRGRS